MTSRGSPPRSRKQPGRARAVRCPDAVEQMALLGVPAGQIAKAAGLRKAQVEAARRVAAANQAVKQAIIEAPSSLDQAAELTTWADDPDAVRPAGPALTAQCPSPTARPA